MSTTIETEEVIDCRNAIESCNIGVNEVKSCASVKHKIMTNESVSLLTQNGGLINDSSDLTTNVRNISNGNVYNSDEEVVHHFECSKYSVKINTNNDNNFKNLNIININNNFNDKNSSNDNNIVDNNSVNDEYNDCISSVDSEPVVMTEEIGHELVISEEQIIYQNTNEDENDIRINQINDNSVCGDEDICDSELVLNNNNGKTDEIVVNDCDRFEQSIDFDAENSSLSESSSEESSVSQPTPINLNNNTAMSVVQSFITAATNSEMSLQSSQLNDSTNSSSISKKKFGKFRILNNEQNKGFDENLNIENSELSLHSEESSIDSRFDRGIITETLSGTQSESSLHDISEHSCASPNASNTPNSKSSKQIKRRGRPAGSTKKDRTPVLPPMLILEDDLNRRRSSRLKSLEERREQEKAIVTKPKDSDEIDENHIVVNSDPLETTQPIDSSINIKQKKKKSKKDKTKKDKNKESDSKKGKRKKKLLTAFEESKQNSFNDQKPEKCKMLETYKNVSNIECFTPPLPPSHYANIKSNSLTLTPPSNKSATDSDETSPRPEKVKSRWRRNSELESGHGFNYDHQKQSAQHLQPIIPKETEPLPPYESIDENIYLFERRKSKSKKETRRMVCDCILTKEERIRGLIGCGDDCLNRMLMIECGSRCSLGEHCANKRFQKKQSAKVEPYKTAKKGWGLRTLEPLQANTFIMEYIGEVVDPLDFHNRVEKYSKEKRQHHYFMALKSDEIIDATEKGNFTRFVNHSCDPNSETQKWTVNGDLRIGFFTQRYVEAGEEITFDYQFQRYGKEAQKCFCESSNCRGYIGATETADIKTDGTKITPKQKLKTIEIDEKEEEYLEDLALEEEIAKLSEGGGLRSRQQVLMLARLMVRAEDIASRLKLISIIKGTIEMAYLRLLLDYHGLQLIWSWMVEVEDIELKAQILEVLEILPIPNKTMLTDSKVFGVVERWSLQTCEESLTIPVPHITSTLLTDEIDQNVTVIVPETTVKLEENPDILTDAVICDESEAIIPVKVKVELFENETHEESKDDMKQTTDDSVVEMSSTTAVEEEFPAIIDDQKDDTKESNETNTEIITECKESSNDIQNSNKSSPRLELRSSSISMLIKPRSVTNVLKAEALQTLPLIKSKPSISAMASKLLVNWKELKEVFRIPRLERQKRHEDEKEADRRTKEVEERRARGLPISLDKRGVDDRDYTIAGILGIKRKGLKRGANDSKDIPSKKNSMSSLQSSHTSASNSSVKISREEHRKLFEMEVAQKDYQEALKRYHQELAYYNAVYGPQFQAQQLYSQDSRVQEQYANTYNNSFGHYYQTDQSYLQPSLPYSAQTEVSVDYMPVESEQISESNEENVDSDENLIFALESMPTLIPVANFDLTEETPEVESTLAIDNVTQDMIVYGDNNEELTQTETIFDPIYPPPGVFYITPDETQHFIAIPTDKKENAVNLSVFDKTIIPYSSTFTKTLANTKLPNNWRHNRDKNGNIYYYNKITRKSQWFPPEEQKQVSPIIEVPVCVDIDQKVSDNEDSISGVELLPQLSPSKIDEMDEPMDSCIDSVPPDSIGLIEEQENVINSAHSSPTLLQSIIALEADPRKRRQLLKSVVPSTTTAAADTSSSLNRKKSFSSSNRKNQEHFRIKLSQYVVHCLNPYRKPDCKMGRILNTEDFKHLARKLTHTIMGKEIKHCKSLDDLSCNEAVKHKTKDYVRKYMARFGTFYKTDNNDKVISPKEIEPNDTND